MQQIAGNANWELSYDSDMKVYFLYDQHSDDIMTIATPEDFMEMADMMQAHMDGNLIQ